MFCPICNEPIPKNVEPEYLCQCKRMGYDTYGQWVYIQPECFNPDYIDDKKDIFDTRRPKLNKGY